MITMFPLTSNLPSSYYLFFLTNVERSPSSSSSSCSTTFSFFFCAAMRCVALLWALDFFFAAAFFNWSSLSKSSAASSWRKLSSRFAIFSSFLFIASGENKGQGVCEKALRDKLVRVWMMCGVTYVLWYWMKLCRARCPLQWLKGQC